MKKIDLAFIFILLAATLFGCTDKALESPKEYLGEIIFTCPQGNTFQEDSDGFISCDLSNDKGFFMFSKTPFTILRGMDSNKFLFAAVSNDNPFVEMLLSPECNKEIKLGKTDNIEYDYIECNGTLAGLNTLMNFGLIYCNNKAIYYGIQYYDESHQKLDAIFNSVKCK